MRSYENKAAGVFVSGYDPMSAVSLIFTVFLCLSLLTSNCTVSEAFEPFYFTVYIPAHVTYWLKLVWNY